MEQIGLPINLTTNTDFTAYWGTKSYETQTWVRIMADSFKAADQEREAMVREGPWTARTDSIARYSRVDFYA